MVRSDTNIFTKARMSLYLRAPVAIWTISISTWTIILDLAAAKLLRPKLRRLRPRLAALPAGNQSLPNAVVSS